MIASSTSTVRKGFCSGSIVEIAHHPRGAVVLERLLELGRALPVALARDGHDRPAAVRVQQKGAAGPERLIVRMGNNGNAVDIRVIHHPISNTTTSIMKSRTIVVSRTTIQKLSQSWCRI